MEGGMRIVLSLGVVALAMGCNGNSVDEDTEVEDSDLVEDTDVTGDTDEDTDPGDTDDTDLPFDGTEIEVRFDGSVGAPWRTAVYLCTFSGADFGLVPVREVASEPYASSPTLVGVPTPDAGDITPLFEEAQGAFYVVYAYLDVDTDGVHDTSEPVVAAAPQYLLYLEDDGGSGLGTGWTGLAMVQGQEEPVPHDPADGFDLQDLRPVEHLTIAGTVDAAVPDTSDGFASISLLESEGLLPNRPIDQPLEDPFTADLDAPIDPGRMTDTDFGLRIGLEYLVAYEDADASGEISVGDTADGFACWDNRQVLLYWIDPITRVDQAFVLLAVGLNPGWQAVAANPDDEPPTRLTDIEAQALVVLPDSTCGAP